MSALPITRPRIDLLAALLGAAFLALALALVESPSPPIAAPSAGRAADSYGKLPLSFIPNKGQTDARVRYYAQGSGYSFYFTDHKAVIALTKGQRGHALELRFLGANPNARLEAGKRASGTVNYFGGNERHTGLATYHALTYRDLWPGIDMTFRGKGGRLEYEFLVRPGADPKQIRLGYAGAEGLSLSKAGNLMIRTSLGILTDTPPRSFQRIGGHEVSVVSGYALGREANYGLAVANYDRRLPLVIDPGLVYSTYLGGSKGDIGLDIAVDDEGAAYVTGYTTSSDFPTTPGAYDVLASGGFDAFVTKLNPAGSDLIYSAYLGGASDDAGISVAVDHQGNAYVTGGTLSRDFPTATVFDPTFDGNEEAFVTKLNPAGSTIVYSTFLGGETASNTGNAIAVGGDGSAYVTGRAIDIFTTPDAFDTSSNGSFDAFVTRVSPTGNTVVYSTYLGGAGIDVGFGIAVDDQGSAYVSGSTDMNFPTTPGAYDDTYAGTFGSHVPDTFVTKVSPTGSSLGYSTYLGGVLGDSGSGIAVGPDGSAYVTGRTESTDFPATPGAYDTSSNGFYDLFITRLNPTGSDLTYSTFVGGGRGEEGLAIDLDDQGNAYVTGSTASSDFPTTASAYDRSANGGSFGDPFVTKLNANGSHLAYSSYLGGSSSDQGSGIAVGEGNSAYLTGYTASVDFPSTVGAYESTLNGIDDVFVTRVDVGPGPPASLTLTPKAATNTVGGEHCVTASVTDAAGTPTPDITVVFDVSSTNLAGGTRTTDPGGQATFCYTGELLGVDEITAFADFDPEDGTQEPGEPSDRATKQWVVPAGELCRGSVSNNGRIVARNGDRASFRGEASASAAGVRGHERYQDRGPAQALTVSSSALQAIICSADGSRASIFGQASIDGSGSFAFRIDVFDGGEPGKGRDTYRILLQTGYDSGVRTLRAGNVGVRLR